MNWLCELYGHCFPAGTAKQSIVGIRPAAVSAKHGFLRVRGLLPYVSRRREPDLTRSCPSAVLHVSNCKRLPVGREGHRIAGIMASQRSRSSPTGVLTVAPNHWGRVLPVAFTELLAGDEAGITCRHCQSQAPPRRREFCRYSRNMGEVVVDREMPLPSARAQA
jgi:hypothetical protein